MLRETESGRVRASSVACATHPIHQAPLPHVEGGLVNARSQTIPLRREGTTCLPSP